MSIIIEGRENIATVRVITLVHALALEINTGMRATRYALMPIAKEYGFTGARKPAALRFLVEKLSEEIAYEPSESVLRALNK